MGDESESGQKQNSPNKPRMSGWKNAEIIRKLNDLKMKGIIQRSCLMFQVPEA